MTKRNKSRKRERKTRNADAKELRQVSGGASMDPLPICSIWQKSQGWF
jgi:hypothetical protein